VLGFLDKDTRAKIFCASSKRSATWHDASSDFRAVQPLDHRGWLPGFAASDRATGCDRKCRAHSAWYSFAHPGRLANAGIGGGRRLVGPFDPQSLAYSWKNADPRWTVSAKTVQEIAAAAERQKESRPATFERIWKAAHTAAGLPAPQINPPPRSQAGVPFLSEPWYCCAEPTRDQLVSIGAQKPLVKNAVASADGFV